MAEEIMNHLDVAFVREQFPALGHEWIFMDNAGGSQTAQPVVDRISDYLLHSNVQLGATYSPSRIATERVRAGAAFAAEFVNARDKSEVILGSSTTMLIRILATCIGRTFATGDEIIVTDCDHEANIGAWAELAQKGITIKHWKINRESFRMEPEDLKALLSSKTRLVAVTHVSNILGTIHPIREIAGIVHGAGALICVDGVAAAPHRLVDVQDSGVDFYALSFYKLFGPHIAVLYGRRDLLLGMPGMCHYFIANDDVPYKFQPGSVNYELSYGLLGIRDYLNALASRHEFPGASFREIASFCYRLFAAHEARLAAPLLDYLNARDGVTIIGETTSDAHRRVPTISFTVRNRASDSISLNMDEHRIGIRYGDFYARRLIEALGLSKQNGVVRASLVHYNTQEEVEKLIRAFDQVL
jgi:cysteine desulfurase family protein (TIGR01976 family)